MVGGIIRVSILANVVQGRWQNFRGRIEISDATGFELGCIGRVEYQVPCVFWHRGAAQGFGHFGFIDGYRGETPRPRENIFIAWVHTRVLAHQSGIEVFVIRDLRFVEFFQQTRLDLCLHKHGARHHDVITRVTCHQFGLQAFIVFEGLVVDFDASFFFEIGDHVGSDVIGPVVNVQDLLFCIHRCCSNGSLGLLLFATSRDRQASQDKP